ncbi:MAG: RNA polymerase sigma factor [Saprospiraceae bacterium]
MTQQEWIDLIQAYKKGDTNNFDKKVLRLFQEDYRAQLLVLTESENDAWDVFVDAMIKFRARYLIDDLPLPRNISAFFYQMQKNVWLDLCRKRNAKRKIKYKALTAADIKQALTTNIENNNQFFEVQEQENNHLASLAKAIEKLCDKCRSLLERHLFDGAKLKVLKTELGYSGSYQTIVEKKKSCIKKLTKLFFIELSE